MPQGSLPQGFLPQSFPPQGFLPRDGMNWRTLARCMALALCAAAFVAVPAANAQSIMRSPNVNIGPRTPNINPNVVSRVDANIAGRTVTSVARVPHEMRTPSLNPHLAARPQ